MQLGGLTAKLRIWPSNRNTKPKYEAQKIDLCQQKLFHAVPVFPFRFFGTCWVKSGWALETGDASRGNSRIQSLKHSHTKPQMTPPNQPYFQKHQPFYPPSE
jgi:hypothetical protein